MQCNESTIYVCPQLKRQYFLQTIENSNLLTNFTTDFTHQVLTIEQITKQTPFLVFYVYTAGGQKIRKSLIVNLTPFYLGNPKPRSQSSSAISDVTSPGKFVGKIVQFWVKNYRWL